MTPSRKLAAGALSEQFQEAKDRYIWVDVRTKEEYDRGHIPDALHIPHDEIEERISELEDKKGKAILLICKSGKRSQMAADILERHGFPSLYQMDGGMDDWKGPIERK